MAGADLSQFLVLLSVAHTFFLFLFPSMELLDLCLQNAGYRDSNERRVCCFDLLSLIFYSSLYMMGTHGQFSKPLQDCFIFYFNLILF